MSEKETLVNPLVQNSLKNLDLDLSFELKLFEYSLNQTVESIATIEKPSISPYQQELSPFIYNDNSPQLEEDPIAVASRIIPNKSQLKDILLSPWGMFGILIFVAANAFIFIGYDLISFNQQNPSSSENEVIEEESSISETDLDNPSKITATQENQLSENPQLRSSPTEVEQDNLENNTQNNNLYPDLKTALLSEAAMQVAIGNNPTPTPPSSARETYNHNSLENQNTAKYYLITDYRSPQYFAQIKKVIPGAMVTNVNEEIKIILGIFNNNEAAQKQAQMFQKQQLPVTIITNNQ